MTYAQDVEFTDEELTALALAADPDDVVFDDDAVPFGAGERGAALLPEWYMPTPMGAGRRSRRTNAMVVSLLVASMVVVNGVGICVTYGIPEVGDRVSTFWR